MLGWRAANTVAPGLQSELATVIRFAPGQVGPRRRVRAM